MIFEKSEYLNFSHLSHSITHKYVLGLKKFSYSNFKQIAKYYSTSPALKYIQP
jgi:hypothetical protein